MLVEMKQEGYELQSVTMIETWYGIYQINE